MTKIKFRADDVRPTACADGSWKITFTTDESAKQAVALLALLRKTALIIEVSEDVGE